jgi:ADP-ribosylglycohydrolase
MSLVSNKMNSKAYAAIWGFIVGDALGVPYEFYSREELQKLPATGMVGWRTHHQPPGTWSDDTSMLLCVMENNYNSGNTITLSRLFLQWYESGYHTAHGNVFDIGLSTQTALERLKNSVPPSKSGLSDSNSAGNGSLMRSLPYAFMEDFSHGVYKMVLHNNITHRLTICHESCIFYVRIARCLAEGRSKQESMDLAVSYLQMGWRISDNAQMKPNPLKRLLKKSFASLSQESISSSGYVVDTLEAAIWCFMNGNDYRSCVLKAVNLGGDTDTIAALTGGLAGIYYGVLDIQAAWRNCIIDEGKLDGMIRTWLMMNKRI